MSSDKGNHKGCTYGNTGSQGIYKDECLEVECRGLEKAAYSLRRPKLGLIFADPCMPN